ncbi:MAG: InlB B-repeat-containing protein, partial [Gammaproteobacteria bacterium]|nr:InlB B-repeat-containing protein [Gammaproteobacteria bacterium]
MPASDVTLYARWLQIYGISYMDASGESGDMPNNSSYIENDTSFIIDTAVPTRDGYVFTGWYTDSSFGGNRYMPGDVYSISGNADVSFHAAWVAAGVLTATPSAIGASYTVIFNENTGGTGVDEYQRQTIAVGDNAVEPAAPPFRPGYDFRGWFSDETLKRAYDFDTAVTGNITLYAGWISQTTRHTVRFFNSNPFIEAQTIGEGGTAVEPAVIPTYLDGFEFSHWGEALTPFGDVTRPY